MTVVTTDISNDVQRERAVLAALELKLSDAMSRRDNAAIEISRTNAEVQTSWVNSGKSPGQPRVIKSPASLVPLNKRATAIDAEIALFRTQITHARRALELAENADKAKAGQAVPIGGTCRLLQLEIRAPDGRLIRQWHKSVDDARKALSHGYEVIGQVISGNIVSPIGGPTIMDSLLDTFGDRLLVWLAERGITDNPVKIVLPSNGREMQS